MPKPVDPLDYSADWSHLWPVFTRLGEGAVLVPIVLLTVVWLARRRSDRALAVRWLLLLSVAVAITGASKLAFMGWGIGSALLNFTGVSGHAMFASAVYPVLAACITSRAPPLGRRIGIGLGLLLPVAIAISRLALHVHSPSEVVLGCLIGFAASLGALRFTRLPERTLNPLLAVVMVVWLSLWFGSTPSEGPTSPALQGHAMVEQLAVRLSGRVEPYSRCDLWREADPSAPLRPECVDPDH